MVLFFFLGVSINYLVGVGDLEGGGIVGRKVGKVWLE